MLIELTLDIDKSEGRFSSLDNAIILRQTDAVAYTIRAEVRQQGAVFDLTGYTVRFYATRPDGHKVIDSVNVLSAPDGIIQYEIPKSFTEVIGDVPNAYFRITSGESFSASTESIAFKIIQGTFMEAAGGDYVPEIDKVLVLLEAQRISYAGKEQERERQWTAFKDDVTGAGGRANSAADQCEAFLKDFSVDYEDMTPECRAKIAASAAAGIEFATVDEINEAFEREIIPVIGGGSETSLTQEDFDWAMAKIFG